MESDKKRIGRYAYIATAVAPVLTTMMIMKASPVLAQAQASAGGGRVLEEVTVTARRKQESLQEVPITITAMSKDYMRENNIGELADISSHVPSLDVSVGGSSTNSPIVSLRGQRPSEVALTLDPAVPLYFADVVLTPTQGTNLSMYDLENAEILKGPQGTLFGRNSTGGAVLFTPTKPGYEFGGYIEGKVGDYNLFGAEGAVDIPVSDAIQLRLAGKKLDRDGYQENVAANELHGNDYWDEHAEAVRISMNFTPNDAVENLLFYDYSSNDMQSRVPTPVAFNGTGDCSFCGEVINRVNSTFTNSGVTYPWEGQVDDAVARQAQRHWTQVETDYDAREKVVNQLAVNTTTWDINPYVTLKNVVGYRNLDFANHFDTDGTALSIFGSRTNGRAIGDLFAVTYHDDYPQTTVQSEQWSEEVQLQITALEDRLDTIVGAFYFQMEGEESSPIQLAPIQSLWRTQPNGVVENTSHAAFTESTYRFSPEFSATVGARYTEDHRELTTKAYGFTATGQRTCLIENPETQTLYPYEDCSRFVEEDFQAFTWRMVGTYTPKDAMMFFANVSTGYRAGGFNMRGEAVEALEPFNEETVLNYELGAKIDWDFDSGLSMRTNMALFWQDYDDIQKTVDAPGPGFGTITVNAAQAVIRGADLDVSLVATNGLSFTLSYSYLDAYYKDWMLPDENNPGEFVDASDRPFDWIPEHSANVSVSYLMPFDPALGDITAKVHYYWQDEVSTYSVVDEFNYPNYDNTQLNDAREADSYGLVDLRLDWTRVMESNFDAAVWVKNLEDKSYVTGGLHVLDSLGWAAEVYGPPRTVGASLRYTF